MDFTAFGTADVLEEEVVPATELVKTKKFHVETMDAEEAILQMNLLDHQFFFFRNAEEDDMPAVIYKRAAGGYGLIEGN